jgi:20S proteasome subunit beta 6
MLETSTVQEPIEHRFNPYADNGGTVLGIAGQGFALIAGDTRHTTGYSINSRFQPRCFDMGDNIILSTVGFAGDCKALVQALKTNMEWYHHDHNKPMKVAGFARLVRQILYGRRMFPYYVNPIMAGLDEDGVGAIYSHDPVGSYERESCRCVGSAASLIMPFLDNQVGFKNQMDPTSNGTRAKAVEYLTVEEALKLVKDSFTSATERHITVGDSLQIMLVTKEGIQTLFYPLKRD